MAGLQLSTYAGDVHELQNWLDEHGFVVVGEDRSRSLLRVRAPAGWVMTIPLHTEADYAIAIAALEKAVSRLERRGA